ncbi:MAG: DsbA family oxidoreductase [Actinomycetota bacterium]
MPEAIQFFFDPMCPYAYQTSKWIRTVRERVGLDITWRFFSLEEVNRVEGKKHPWEREWSYGFGQMRVGALIRRERGNGELDRWYATVGPTFFEQGIKTHVPAIHAEVIGAAGFDATVVERAIADPTTTDDVRADHEFAAATYGAHGVPTIVFASEYATYGPVVVPAPEGDDAVALWELVKGMERFPHLYELRHPKTMGDILHVGNQFRTYLTTRDWQTVENPAP